MAPIIEVSDETLKTLNPAVYTRRTDLESPRVEVVSEPYIEVPEIGLAVAKQLTHHSKNWYEQQEALRIEGSIMLPTRKFAGFLNFLIAHPENKEYQAILEEIVGVRVPYRAENLDNYFVNENGEWYVLTQNRTHSEKLAKCLMRYKPQQISLKDWTKNPTKQGLARVNISNGKLFYWRPRNERTTRFFAFYGGVGLDCGDDPSTRGLSCLGARAAKQLK